MHPPDCPPLSRYDRHRHLPRLLPLTAADIANGLLDDQPSMLPLMRRALEVERRNGLSGAWHYDAARHRQLLYAFRTELENQPGQPD